jgi:uncharacterized membrane protein
MTRDITAARPRKTAQGAAARAPLTLYRLFWLFLIAGVLGDFIEVAFWLATRGELTSRSSLLYGPFSIVWGMAAVLLTLVFHRMDDMSAARIFMTGAVLGGVYEYICSLIQEVFFGASFWDYRHLPLNLNGRINLVFCLFWGGAAVVWVRLACPALSRFIERIPRLRGRRIAIAAALFLTFSALLSACALGRMGQRQQGVPASGAVARFLDENYPDGALYSRYPNMKLCAGLD